MYSFVEPDCFYVPPSMQWGAIPQYIQLFLNISVNRVRVEGPSIGRVEVPIRKFGVDSDAGRLHAAVGSILAVYEEMQAYHPRDVDRGLYIYVQGRNIEL